MKSLLFLVVLAPPLLFGQNDSLVQRAIRLSAQGRYAEGISVLRSAGADTGSAFARAQLGLAYANLNDFPNARTYLSEAVRMDSANVDILFQYARFLHLSFVLPEAREAYAEVLRRDSLHGAAWFQLAQVSRIMGASELLIRQYYRSSIRVNPNDYLAYFYLGSSLADFSETMHEGEFFLKRSLEINPYFLPAIERLGSYNSALRRDSIAAYYYSQAVGLRPMNPDFWFYLGESVRKLRSTDSAIVCFETAMRLDPTKATYTGQLGYAYVQAKDYPAAAGAYERAISLEPENVQYYTNLAIAYERMDSVALAVHAYERAVIALQPELISDAFNQIGHVYYRAHRYADAERAYEKALAYQPGNAETLFFLALVLDQREEYAQALRYYRDFLKALPKSDTLNARRGVAETRVKSIEQLLSKKK